MVSRRVSALLIMVLCVFVTASAAGESSPKGWISLFNGRDLTGWRVSDAADQSWSVTEAVIDCDPKSTLSGDRNIWTEESFGDFILHIEWRFKDTPTVETWPLIGPDGRALTDQQGDVKTATFANADSGIFLRGMDKAQINIWNWPIGSGEIWGYRTDQAMPDQVRAAATPSVRADKPIGQWNTYLISVIGNRVSVILNGKLVIDNAQLPGLASSGPLGLQYHGGYDHQNQRYLDASSLVQFRNIYIKPLD